MKKIISLFLAVIMLSCSTVTAFSAEEDLSKEIINLSNYAEKIDYIYGIYPVVGNAYIRFSTTSFIQLINDIDSTYEMIECYYIDRSSVTQEMIDEAYDTLDTSVNNLRVETSELEFLLDICKPEQNINNYYSDELWTEFQQCISNAENALNTGENEDEITKAYWDLRYAFNKLCSYNQLMGDIDGNGVVNINDCTLLSKAIAELTTLNYSQKYVASGVYGISITNVTDIQKYLVNDKELDNKYLTEVTENIYSQHLDTNYLYYRLVFLENVLR